MKKMNIKNRKRIFQIVFIGAILFFFVTQLIFNWNRLLEYEWRFNYKIMIIATLIYICTILFNSAIWHLIFKKLGEKLSISKGMKIWLLSMGSKYLPGTVWRYLSQIHLCKKEGIARTKTIAAQVIEFSMDITSSLLVFIIAIFFWERGIVGYKEVIILTIIIAGTILFLRSSLLKQLINFGLRIIKREPIHFNLSLSGVLSIFSVYVVFKFIQGTAFYLFVLSITDVPLKILPIIAGVFCISWVAGYLFVIAPGGLGVREGALVFFLSFFFTLPVAIVISLSSRVWIMICEFITILIGYNIKR